MYVKQALVYMPQVSLFTAQNFPKLTLKKKTILLLTLLELELSFEL
jgi:hypothetical protein